MKHEQSSRLSYGKAMKLIMLIFLFLFSHVLYSQKCDCLSQLSYTISYFEKNNPAFQKIKSNTALHNLYLREVKKIQKEAARNTDIDQCIFYLDEYVNLLKDHHSNIGFNLKRMDLSTPELIAEFKKSKRYKQFKKIQIDTAKLIPLLNTKKQNNIEGIYSNGTGITFGIIKNEKNPRNYIAVVLKNNKLLEVGHVLMDLIPAHDNTYNVTYYTGLLGFNFKSILKSQKIENGIIPSFGFSKIKPALNEAEYEFKELNDSTNYIRLRSFDGMLVNELDSFYNAIHRDILRLPYLVIDIRNNGGGDERAYLDLLKYAYTKPLTLDSVNVWVSPENIKRYEEISAEKNKRLLERMKAAQPFTFIPLTEDESNTWSLDSTLHYPKKIALLFDRGTASAAEGMIYYFMQSEKVITIGENTGGYMGYGNVMTAQTPCENFTIRSTTTRYFKKSKYEYVGIGPMYKISKKDDWIAYAKKLLTVTGRSR